MTTLTLKELFTGLLFLFMVFIFLCFYDCLDGEVIGDRPLMIVFWRIWVARMGFVTRVWQFSTG
jgi:hypothetical protein